MSGHNKWSKIKNKKAVTDAKKSKIFTMHAKKIVFESKIAGGDTEMPNLKNAIVRARADNMPNDNIDRAVKKGAGGEGAELEEVRYEAYGPGGTAIIIEGITDSKNRTTQEIKHIFSKRGFEISPTGAAIWAFTKEAEGWKANQTVKLSEGDEEKLGELLDEIDDHDDIENIFTNAE